MNNNLIKLLSILKENEELSNKMKACTSPEEAYAFACTVADGYTKEEFVAFMEKIKNNNTSSPELTEDDLQQVSGGLTEAASIDGDFCVYTMAPTDGSRASLATSAV